MSQVTLVRRKTVYEEIVMSVAEFNALNKKIKDRADDLADELDELKMKDIGFPDLTLESIEYIAFPGDVTSYTDDAIAFMFEDQEWTDGFLIPINIAS